MIPILHDFHQTYNSFFPAVLAGAGLINLASGFFQSQKAGRELKDLEKHKPAGYDITPEQQNSYDRAQQLANSGFTQDEKSAYLGNLASANNQSYNKAFAYGGNTLAGAIRSGVNYSNLGALNSLAVNDAQLHRQNIHYADQQGQQISAQRNRNTGQKLQEYHDQQVALGQAQKAGKENMLNSVNMFAALSGGGGSLGGAKGLSGTPYSGAPMANYGLQDPRIPPSVNPDMYNLNKQYGSF